MLAIVELEPPEIAAGGQVVRLLLGIGADHEHAGIGPRGGEMIGRLELLPVVLHHRSGHLGRDEVGEGIGEPEMGRVGCALVAGAEQPDFRRIGHRRGGADIAERLRRRNPVVEEGHHVGDLGREILDPNLAAIGERGGGEPVAARRATDPEIDPPGIEILEQLEVLRHLQR